MRMAVVSILAITFAGCANATGDPSTSGSDPQALSRDGGADVAPCAAPGTGNGKPPAEGGETRPAPGSTCADSVKQCYVDGRDAAECDALAKKCELPSPDKGGDCTGKMVQCMAAGGDNETCEVQSCSTEAEPGPGAPKPCLMKVQQCKEQGIDGEMCSAIEKSCDEPPTPSDACTTVCNKTDDGGETCNTDCPRPPSAACTNKCWTDGEHTTCEGSCSAPAPGKAGPDDCVAKVIDCLDSDDDASTCKALAEQCKPTTDDAPPQPADPQAAPS